MMITPRVLLSIRWRCFFYFRCASDTTHTSTYQLSHQFRKNHTSKILGRGRLNRYSGTFHWKRNKIIVIAVYYCAFFLFQIFGWDESFSALVMHCLGAQAKKLHKEAILQQPILEVSHKRVFWKLDIKIFQSNDKKDKCPSKIGFFLAWAIDSYSFSVIIDHRVIECWHTVSSL